MDFGDPKFSLALRDYIREMIKAELENSRPRYRYAQVTAVNVSPKTATVQYPDGSTVSVRYGALTPTQNDIVRVDGLVTDRFIADIL